MGKRHKEKTLEEILEQPDSTTRGYIRFAELRLEVITNMICEKKQMLEKMKTPHEKFRVRSIIERLQETADLYERQLPIYKKALELKKMKTPKEEIVDETTRAFKSRALYVEMLDFTNKAVERAMNEGEVKMPSFVINGSQAIIAISPYLGNRAIFNHNKDTYEYSQKQLAYKKMLAVANKEESSDIVQKISMINSLIAESERTKNSVLHLKPSVWIYQPQIMAEYLYRLERHIQFNHGYDFGNVNEIRYSDGVIWVLIDLVEIVDPSLKKQITSACSRCYLPTDHAVLSQENSMPEGYVLWSLDRCKERLFSMKWEDLLCSHTYANVWYRVASEMTGRNKKSKWLRCANHWWNPVDINDINKCKPLCKTVDF